MARSVARGLERSRAHEMECGKSERKTKMQSIPECGALAKHQTFQEVAHVDCAGQTLQDSFQQLREEIRTLRKDQECTVDALGSLIMSVAENCASTCRQMEASVSSQLQQFKKIMLSELYNSYQTLDHELELGLATSSRTDLGSTQGDVEVKPSKWNRKATCDARTNCQFDDLEKVYTFTHSLQMLADSVQQSLQQSHVEVKPSEWSRQATSDARKNCQFDDLEKLHTLTHSLQMLADSIQQSLYQPPLHVDASNILAEKTSGEVPTSFRHSATAAASESSQLESATPGLQAYHSAAALFRHSGQEAPLQEWCCPGEGPPPPAFSFNRGRRCGSSSGYLTEQQVLAGRKHQPPPVLRRPNE